MQKAVEKEKKSLVHYLKGRCNMRTIREMCIGSQSFPSYGKMKIQKMWPKTWAFNWIHPCVCVQNILFKELLYLR